MGDAPALQIMRHMQGSPFWRALTQLEEVIRRRRLDTINPGLGIVANRQKFQRPRDNAIMRPKRRRDGFFSQIRFFQHGVLPWQPAWTRAGR